MFIHLFKSTIRTITRNTRFLVVGVLGLAIAFLAALAILTTVSYERSFDQEHPTLSNSYRLSVSYVDNEGEFGEYAGVSNMLGKMLQDEYPEVQAQTRVFPVLSAMRHCILSSENLQVPVEFNVEHMFGIDHHALDIFDIRLELGDREAWISSIDGIALSRSMATRFFGDENPIGKMIRLNAKLNMTVQAVFEDWTDNNHFLPEVLVWNDHLIRDGVTRDHLHFLGDSFYTYLALAPGVNHKTFEQKLPGFVSKHKRVQDYEDAALHLMPLKDIHLKAANLKGDMANVTDSKSVYLLVLLAFLIVAIACFNYVNLSCSFALQRTKEILVRKVHGAGKWSFFRQLLVNTFTVYALAFILALTVYQLQSDWLKRLLGQGDLSHLLADHQVLLLSILVMAGIIIGTSFYPVTLLSAFKSSDLIKGRPMKSQKGQMLRKLLVGLQYAITIGLLFGTLTVTFQLEHLKSVDAQIEMDDVMVVQGPGVKSDQFNSYTGAIEVFKNKLIAMPGISSITTSNHVPGFKVDGTAILANPDIHPDTVNFVHRIYADEDFNQVYGLELLSGRYFNEQDINLPSKQRPLVVNLSAARDLGFNTAEEAVGQNVVYWDRSIRIIGVLSDFSMESMDKKVPPTFIFPSRDSKYFSIRLSPGMKDSYATAIGEAFQEVYPGNPFDYFYSQAHFDQQYSGFELTRQRLRLLGLLSICLAGLGLFAALQDMIRQRLKEFCIRKILGAGLLAILNSLARGYLKIVVLAALVTVPLLYIFLEDWLNQYANRIEIGWVLLVIPTIGTLFLTFVVILSHSIKAIRINPAELLRNE